MNAAHVKTALAALALAGTPNHLRASQSIAMGAGAAPQGAAPRAADPGFSWDDVVADLNATLPSAATAHLRQTAASQEPAPAHGQADAGFSWDDVVAEVNAANGFGREAAR